MSFQLKSIVIILAALMVVALSTPTFAGAQVQRSKPLTSSTKYECESTYFASTVKVGTLLSAEATSGSYTAVFSGVRVKERYLSLFADFSVKASNSGRLLFSRSFNNRTQLPNFAPSEAMMCVARFAGSITPSVVLMYSDYGSNCCVYVDGFSLAPSNRTGAYAGIVEFQDAIRGMTRAKGHVVVVGVDNSFSGAFGAQAGNALPIKIYEFRDGKFVDTTRNYLGLIARDAAQWLRTFKSQTTAVHDLAPLAAWVADEDLLRKSSSAWNYVDQLESEGQLVTGPDNGPSGTAFIQRLKSILVAGGYQSG